MSRALKVLFTVALVILVASAIFLCISLNMDSPEEIQAHRNNNCPLSGNYKDEEIVKMKVSGLKGQIIESASYDKPDTSSMDAACWGAQHLVRVNSHGRPLLFYEFEIEPLPVE